MANDELGRFEAMMGALSNSLSGNEDDGLAGARCPKCEASSFVRVSELYDDAVRRLSEPEALADVPREGGKTDRQIVETLSPPQRKSARGIMLGVAVPLAAIALYVYRRFGDTLGQAAIAAAIVLTVIVFLTNARRLSDEYYARRNRWNKLFMCRKCGQLVAG